jgi:hypothetical protein
MSIRSAIDAERADRVSTRDVLLHPLALVAVGTLVINDHLLKIISPSWLTGKLSDVAGLVIAPLLLSILLGTLSRISETRRRPQWPIVCAVLATAFGFAAVKVLPVPGDIYRQGLGYLQWPLVALASLPDVPPVRPVLLAADLSDLLALPVLVVPLLIVLRPRRGGLSMRRQRLAGGVLVVCSAALLGTSPATPTVFGTERITPVIFSNENPTAAWEITLTASAGALPTTFAIAGVSVHEPTGPNTLRTRDDIELTLIGLRPHSAIQAALDVNRDELVGDLEWRPFKDCEERVSCTETYRLDARWIDPTAEPISVEVEISVSIPYDVGATIPSDAQVHIDIGSP